MPLYIFQHPKTKKIIEIIQSMNEEHVFIDEKGIKWDRIFTKPQASIDTQIDPNSSKEFVSKTAKRGMTIGEMMDLSGELSEKRGGVTGKDEVRDKAEKSYKEKTGKRHPHAKKNSTFYI
jgi:hypothetical protein